jgi:hypothetical protein
MDALAKTSNFWERMMVERNKLDELFDVAVSSAFALLEKNGEFFPLGASIAPDGTVGQLAVFDGDEHPESQTVINGLTQAFGQQAAEGAILASAISFDARVRSPETGEAVDAIITRIRAKEYARDIAVPYTLRTKGLFKKVHTVEQGQATASEGQQDIFN